MNKIILFVNYNLYESKRHFTKKLVEALQRKDIHSKIIDVEVSQIDHEMISKIKMFNPDATASFNSFLPLSENKFLWDFLEIPHISFLVDPAIYSVHLTSSPYSILSCVDRFDIENLKSYHFDRTFFWPHAVEKDLDLGNYDRIYDVVLLGTCYDYDSLRNSWRNQFSDGINRVLDDAIDIILSDDKIPLSQALVNSWKSSSLDPSNVDFNALFYYLDTYTRGKDRLDLVKNIKDAHIHIFGELSKDDGVGVNGWKDYLNSQKNITFHSSVTFGHSFDILRKSKICLNSMPFFRDGTHERIFAGLACGSLPITSESIYLRESFVDGNDLIFYQALKRDLVNEKINLLLGDEKKRLQMIESGREKVMNNHTWDSRVDELLKIFTS